MNTEKRAPPPTPQLGYAPVPLVRGLFVPPVAPHRAWYAEQGRGTHGRHGRRSARALSEQEMGERRRGSAVPAVLEPLRGQLLGHHGKGPDSLPVLRWGLLYQLLQSGALHA